jgi:hypothetical protein
MMAGSPKARDILVGHNNVITYQRLCTTVNIARNSEFIMNHKRHYVNYQVMRQVEFCCDRLTTLQYQNQKVT